MVIRMRHTRAHTKNRRSHHALKAPTLAVCSNCGAMHRPHHMCLECGFYKGKMVVDMTAKRKARADRMQAKKDAIAEQAAQFAPEAEAPEAVEAEDTKALEATEETKEETIVADAEVVEAVTEEKEADKK